MKACVGPGAVGFAVSERLAALGYTLIEDEFRTWTEPVDEPVDVAVATIGRMRIGDAASFTFQDALVLIESNYLLPRCFIERQAGAMKRDGVKGHIVVLGSNASIFGNPFADDYAAGKSALKKYCELRARVLRDSGIRISLLNFGGIEGPFWDKATKGAPPELAKTIVPGARKPLTIEDAAAVVVATILMPENVTMRDCLVVARDYQ